MRFGIVSMNREHIKYDLRFDCGLSVLLLKNDDDDDDDQQ